MITRPFLTLAALLASSAALSADAPKGPTLRQLMQDLGGNGQRIAVAIGKENWSLVADTAAEIAAHPALPEAEEQRIKGLLGTDYDKFEALDAATHKAATALAETAKKGDGHAIIDDYAKLQHACFACHQAFRKRVHP
jgi:cytochrome c556